MWCAGQVLAQAGGDVGEAVFVGGLAAGENAAIVAISKNTQAKMDCSVCDLAKRDVLSVPF